jgi:riboflavin kinase / FMN adenylyltransferase
MMLELTGIVVTGDRRGRTIGFPTANLIPRPEDPPIPLGVYAAWADDRPAAVNVGVRPTFQGATPGLVVEVHVLDFSGDLYGHKLRVRFVEKLRDERPFASVDELIEQLKADVQAVRVVLKLSR